MTYGYGWTPPPPPPRRYAPWGIVLGVAAGIAITLGFPFVGLVLSTRLNSGVLAWVAYLTFAIPLIVGIVLTAMQGSPARRGFGLGLIIGWALSPIVFAGLCILVIVGAYTVPGFPGGVA